jgi:GTP-binding protein EngB required for normal cell division
MVKVMDDKQVQIDEADTKLSKIKTSTKTAQKKLKEVNEDIEKRGKSRQEFVTLFQAEKKELIGSRDRELSFLIEETEVKKKECREIDAHTKELRKDQEKLEKAV